MKGIHPLFRLTGLLCLMCINAFAYSDLLKFEVNQPSVYSNYTVPAIDFSNPTSVELIAGNIDGLDEGYPYGGHLETLRELEIVFPNANNLVVTNLEHVENGRYVAVVEDAWIYKSVLVSVETFGPLMEMGDMLVRAFILDSNSNIAEQLNNPEESDYLLFDLYGSLIDIRPRALADRVTVNYQGKKLTIKAFRNLKVGEYNSKIDLNINWLGHGNVDTLSYISLPIESLYSEKVIAVNITGLDTESPMVVYTLQAPWGEHTVETSLATLLEITFPQPF